MSIPAAGDFVEVRTRRWLVESVAGADMGLRAQLACIDDDAQGETLEVLWRDEVDAAVVADSHLSVFENPGTDDPEVFSAYLRSIRWNTATAADRKLLQALVRRHPRPAGRTPRGLKPAFRRSISSIYTDGRSRTDHAQRQARRATLEAIGRRPAY
jgi:hypothetical protein